MVDDRRKRTPRPGSIMGDDERASQPRPPQSWPVHVDPEVTPPPQAPPLPSSAATLPPLFREAIDTLHRGQESLAQAVGRVWDVRHDSDRLQRLDDKVDTLAEDVAGIRATITDFLRPAVANNLMPRVDDVERTAQLTKIEQKPLLAAVEKLIAAVERLEERFDRLERNVERLTDADKALGERIAAQSTVLADVTVRLAALEHRNVIADAGDKREQALVVRSKAKRAAIVGALVTAGGAVWAVAQWLVSYLR